MAEVAVAAVAVDGASGVVLVATVAGAFGT